jgi:hypothetical protein
MEAMWKSYLSHVMGKPYSASWKPSESHGKPSDVNVVKNHMKVELGEAGKNPERVKEKLEGSRIDNYEAKIRLQKQTESFLKFKQHSRQGKS